MRLLCFGYRDWALKIYQNIKKLDIHDVEIVHDISKVNNQFISSYKPHLVLFYGWSWKIDQVVAAEHKCLMLHPSDLPKYRGGSPIQNQIIDGIKNSAVTIFRMSDKMDAGPIVKKAPLNLDGNIDNIFDRLATIGTALTLELLSEYPAELPQDEKGATYCKRRSPEMSEITISEIETCSSEYLNNKIRSLTGPYPRAYIVCSDGRKLFIEESSLDLASEVS